MTLKEKVNGLPEYTIKEEQYDEDVREFGTHKKDHPEIKFVNEIFNIDKDYAMQLRSKKNIFIEKTKSKKIIDDDTKKNKSKYKLRVEQFKNKKFSAYF